MADGVRQTVQRTIGRGLGALLAAGTALRRARVFHPDGVAYAATLRVTPAGTWGVPLLDEPGEHAAIVRLSAGAGLPKWAPDLVGLAIRLPGADQDLLLSSVAGEAPGLRMLLAPSTRTYSTIQPLATPDGARLLLAAQPDTAVRRYEALREAAAAGTLRFGLLVATPTGPWSRWATLEVGAALPPEVGEALAFDPARAGAGLRPAGWLTNLRLPAYRRSQAARGEATPGNDPARDAGEATPRRADRR